MALPVFTHPACLSHDPGPDHPETTARLCVRCWPSSVLIPPSTYGDAAPATLEPILRVHPQAYLDSVRAFSLAGGGALTGDTTLNAQSWDAALGAAGAVLAATDLALTGGAMRSPPCVRRGTTPCATRRWGSAWSTTSSLRRMRHSPLAAPAC